MAYNNELRIDNGDIIMEEKYSYENPDPGSNEFGWTYRVYRSGWVEMWYSNTRPFSFTANFGTLFRSNNSVTINYPFAIPLHTVNLTVEDPYAFGIIEYANDFGVKVLAVRSERLEGTWYLPVYLYVTGNQNWRAPGSDDK